MNGLSLQNLGLAQRPSYAGERFYALPAYVQRQMAARVLDWGVMQGIDEIRRRRPGAMISGFGDLSQADQQAVADSASNALTQILGGTAKSLSAQAADVMGPVIEQKLKEYGPTFAIIAGLVAAVFGIVGMALVGGYVIRKVG